MNLFDNLSFDFGSAGTPVGTPDVGTEPSVFDNIWGDIKARTNNALESIGSNLSTSLDKNFTADNIISFGKAQLGNLTEKQLQGGMFGQAPSLKPSSQPAATLARATNGGDMTANVLAGLRNKNIMIFGGLGLVAFLLLRK